ncbi:DUF2993 domain-containing protein [Streptomyces sp. NPDC046261]|uniref:DUF2993 domain-containing protein n=1 Tax=Streptomyces sp. NPDC046261 TaxID=3157200 RepID=UPI00340E453A
MRTPTRISRPANPYEELAALADPDPLHAGQAYDEPAEPPLLATGDDEPWSPPDHRRHRRARGRRQRGRGRRRPPSPLRTYRRAAKWLFVLVAGAAFLVLADRCAVMYAEKKAQQQLQQALHLAAEPQVDIHGFPFLTQVLAKRLQEVDVTVLDVAADRVSLAKVRASARDIRLTGSLPTGVKGAVVGDLGGSVLLSFEDMSRELGASQIRFSDRGGNAISADGRLSLAGQELRLRAQAQLRRDGDRAVSTRIDGVSVDIPRVATYRPGPGAGTGDDSGAGSGAGRSLTLHREAADRISRDAAHVKELLSVPAVAARLGVSEEDLATALRSEERLREITGAPRFVEELTRINLVDVVLEHPWLLEKLGLDPKLLTALTQLQPPALTDRLSLSFRLPPQARDLHLSEVTVQRDGIRVELSATDLAVGRNGVR